MKAAAAAAATPATRRAPVVFDLSQWEEFVRTWQTSQTLDEVSRRTGVERAKVSTKAAALRKLGVDLKKIHGRRGPKLSASEILKLKSIAKQALLQGTIVQPGGSRH